MPYHALIDIGTGTVLTIHTRPSIIIFLQECIPESTYAIHVQSPHYMGSFFGRSRFFLSRIDPAEYPKWTWDRKKRALIRTRADLLTPELIERARLAHAKGTALNVVIHNLNLSRIPIRSGMEMQDVVYMTKRLQAERFRDSGYDEDIIMDVPYVLQYADLVGCSPREAADDILFKARLDDEHLAKTEALRLKYSMKLRDESDAASIDPLVEAFLRECYRTRLG